MNYYVRANGRIDGPFTIDELNKQIAVGALNANDLATADIGEPKKRILRLPDSDWLFLAEIPGLLGLPKPPSRNSSARRQDWIIGVVVVVFVIVIVLMALYGAFVEAIRDLH